MLKQIATAVPEDCRENIIIIGSLAAGYHFFGDNASLMVRTKGADCLLVAQNHPANEMLCVIAEECTSYAEYPEIVNLLNELRAMPKDEFEALATVCDPRVLREFFPELPEDHTRPTRLLASARVFDAIQRTGSEDYLLDGQIIAKGYRAALEALTLDPSVAAIVAAKVEGVVSGDGVSAALAKLVAAKANASAFVPKEFVKMFKAGVDEAIDEVGRRNVASAH